MESIINSTYYEESIFNTLNLKCKTYENVNFDSCVFEEVDLSETKFSN